MLLRSLKLHNAKTHNIINLASSKSPVPYSSLYHSIHSRVLFSAQSGFIACKKKKKLLEPNQTVLLQTNNYSLLREHFFTLGRFGTNIAILGSLFFAFGVTYIVYNIFKDDQETKECKEIEKALDVRRKNLVAALSDVKPISVKHANDMLTKDEASVLIKLKSKEKTNSIRIDSNQVASNKDIEDRCYIDTEIKNDVLLVGVFDGHSGTNCSEYVSKNLPLLVRKEIEPLFLKLSKETSYSSFSDLVEETKETIQDSFCQLDDSLIHEIRKTKSNLSREDLLPAVDGSCALLAAVDLANENLFVACTGDSRAIMGSLQENGKWIAVPLSKDQTARNPKELSRILKEHPGEIDTVVRRGRILGRLEPSRAFGDARYKWDLATQLDLYSKFFPEGKSPPKNLLSPPYVTAKPEVHFHKINPRNDQFLVLATDGLYDELSNQQIVELVGDHLSRPFLKTDKFMSLRSKKGSGKAYTFQDSNLATHLIRNAIGGCQFENIEGEITSTLMLKRLSIPAPDSRKYRDDMTVVVLQFGSFEKS